MKKTIKALTLVLLFFTPSTYAFDEGFVISLRADFMGSLTSPKINEQDLQALAGANKMDGMAGFLVTGEAELNYIFNAKKWFNTDTYLFSGLGWGFVMGVGEGHSGQISGSEVDGKQINVFVNVYYTPVINYGTSLRAYMFDGRMTLGTFLGVRMIADPAPTYQMYNSEGIPELTGVGTMIIDAWQKEHMNPFAFQNRFFLEYNQPVVDRMEVVFKLFMGYNIYAPGYATMPFTLLKSAEAKGFNRKRPLNSFYLNSMDFGLTLGLNFKG